MAVSIWQHNAAPQQIEVPTGMANSAPEAAWTSTEDLFDRTLGSRPSANHLALIKKAENERPEVKEFLHRALRLMAIAKLRQHT